MRRALRPRCLACGMMEPTMRGVKHELVRNASGEVNTHIRPRKHQRQALASTRRLGTIGRGTRSCTGLQLRSRVVPLAFFPERKSNWYRWRGSQGEHTHVMQQARVREQSDPAQCLVKVGSGSLNPIRSTDHGTMAVASRVFVFLLHECTCLSFLSSSRMKLSVFHACT